MVENNSKRMLRLYVLMMMKIEFGSSNSEETHCRRALTWMSESRRSLGFDRGQHGSETSYATRLRWIMDAWGESSVFLLKETNSASFESFIYSCWRNLARETFIFGRTGKLGTGLGYCFFHISFQNRIWKHVLGILVFSIFPCVQKTKVKCARFPQL